MSNYTIVVAKYKEDTSWTDCVKDRVKIYNKGPDGDIPNIGREGETFLRYIIENYDNLPDYIIVLQGDPFAHMPPSVNENTLCYFLQNKKFDNPNWKIEPCYGIYLTENIDDNPGLLVNDYYKFFFGKDIEDGRYSYVAGCQFFIRKEAILQNPKELYIKLQSMLVKGSEKYEKNHAQAHKGPNDFDETLINGWTLERLWQNFFM
jgi:hypothetical protein